MKLIKTRVKNVISDSLSIASDDIPNNLNDLHLDSLDILDLTYRLEEEFDIQIETSEMIKFHELNELVKLVETKIEFSKI